MLSMNRWHGKVAIVTGASSGIGAAIAVRLVKEGLKVLGVARRKDKLETLAETTSSQAGRFYPYVADLSNEENILKMFKWVHENVGPTHILINNAGIFKPLDFLGMEGEFAKDILDTNVLSVAIASSEALALFKKHNISGHIINMNSLAGHRVMNYPGISIYSASKHAVTALTKTLIAEIRREKLSVKATSISPGLVESEMTAATEEIKQQQMRILGHDMLKADDIVEAVIYILSTPPHCQIEELTITAINTRS